VPSGNFIEPVASSSLAVGLVVPMPMFPVNEVINNGGVDWDEPICNTPAGAVVPMPILPPETTN
jgi:hypothetical protein